MARSPLVAKKLSKMKSPAAVGKELQRRCHVYENNVDTSLSYLNEDYVRSEDGRMRPVKHGDANPEELVSAIDRRIGELKTKRKPRKDAVRAVGFVISTEGALQGQDALDYLHEAIDWMQDRYGQENLAACSIHMDEGEIIDGQLRSIPHAQLWTVPVIHDDETGFDRLCCKELFSPDTIDKKTKQVLKRGTMSKLQEDFYREVASKYGFEKPLTREDREKYGIKYGSQRSYKATREAEKFEQKRDELKQEVAEISERLERLRRTEEERTEEVEALESASGTVSESRAIIDEGKDVDARVERLASEVESARARVLELDGRKTELEGECRSLRFRVQDARGRALDLIAKVRDLGNVVFQTASGKVRDWLEKHGGEDVHVNFGTDGKPFKIPYKHRDETAQQQVRDREALESLTRPKTIRPIPGRSR